MLAAASSGAVLLELGAVLLVLAVLGRLAGRIGLPSIPLYLVAGLAMGDGGLVPLDASEEFIGIGADVGVVLLLLLLGLEYSSDELFHGLRGNWRAGLADLVANSAPGVAVGLALGWEPVAAVLLGGVTYISSSGIIAKLLDDLGRLGNRETPVVLSILVMEDLAMAAFLPIVGVLLVGGNPAEGTLAVFVALAVVAAALALTWRFGDHLSGLIATRSNEVLLLTVLGLTLLVAGLAEEVQVSAAVGAFLIGLSLSGPVAEAGRGLLTPMRDVFGGLFFVFFGLRIDVADLPPVLVAAVVLAGLTAATKYATGWWAAAQAGIGRPGRRRAGASLVPRGEFSIVIAGLGVSAGTESDLGSLAAAYVLVMAVAGSLAMRFADWRPRAA